MKRRLTAEKLSEKLLGDILLKVNKPGQYLGNEWGARRKPFNHARVTMALAFPDMYELGMSNFGLKILYQILNDVDGYLVDRTYAPGSDLEALMRAEKIPLWGFESREPLQNFDLLGFSLQYELTYTNVLNMLELAELPVRAAERTEVFPLVFGGGPSAVNPEPMALFLDFFMIGDGEEAMPAALAIVDQFKRTCLKVQSAENSKALRLLLLTSLALKVPGIYVPALYDEASPVVKAKDLSSLLAKLKSELPELAEEIAALAAYSIPERVLRQVAPLTDANQPVRNLVPYLALVHDREVLEVRRGCDRGCRFCQPGYTFLPVRERSANELVELSKKALANSGHEEYSLLSLCVSDYTSLHDSVRALNREHSDKRTSLSFPSQRADRMNLDIAEELKTVRRSGITLAPEAGTEKLRAVINKGLSHSQIINAIDSAYESGWQSVKLYFMCGLPFEDDDDLKGIIEILKEATHHSRVLKKNNPLKYKRELELTCTISNFVPKPFTPFQWFAQVSPEEFSRKHAVLRQALRESGLRRVTLNVTDPQISLLEAVISRGDRNVGEMIYQAWKRGCVFDAWDERFKPAIWHAVAEEMGTPLLALASMEREPGSLQPYDIVHIGLHHWWLKREWEKAVNAVETAACTENTCHACGICTELDTNHVLASPSPGVMKKNPFVKELNANKSDSESHPSLFFVAPVESKENKENETTENFKYRLVFTKVGDLRFVGHLDLQNLLIRAIRRAGLNLAYSKGFNPSPKLSLACPLPLFQEGLRELADLELVTAYSPDSLKETINRELPPEVQIVDCLDMNKKNSEAEINVPPVGKTSLASIVALARYRATPLADSLASVSAMTEMKESIEKILSAEHLYAPVKEAVEDKSQKRSESNAKPATESGKDLRPLIHEIKLLDKEQGPVIEFTVATGSNGHLKPQDLLELLCPYAMQVTRLELLTRSGEPIVPQIAHLDLVRGSV